MGITLEEARQTAQLARLQLDDDELLRLARELDAILGYVQVLARLDTDGVEPTTHALPLAAPLRADVVGDSPLDGETALAGAPRRDGRYFVVPQVVDAGRG